jgi:hypothetical protein
LRFHDSSEEVYQYVFVYNIQINLRLINMTKILNCSDILRTIFGCYLECIINGSFSPIEHSSSNAGEFHPYILTETYMNLSIHTALLIQSQRYKFRGCTNSHCWLLAVILFRNYQSSPPAGGLYQILKQNKLAPPLHPHYRRFITTTG